MKDRKALILLGALLVVGVAVAFGNALGCGFVFDDLGAIVRNPSLHALRTALAPPPGGFTTTGRPCLNLSFAANYAIGGLNPAGYHAINVMIHGLAAVVLMALAYRTTKSVPLAFAAALLWALHPLQTESVTYVSQRAESMMGLFYLLTLLCLPSFPILAVGCCLAGMATKEDMASAPIIALLYDKIFLSGSLAAAWRARRATYLALFSSWLLLAWEIAAAKGRGGTIGFNLAIPYGRYLLIQASAITHYLRLAAWPTRQIFDYALAPAYPTLAASLALLAFLTLAAAGITVSLSESSGRPQGKAGSASDPFARSGRVPSPGGHPASGALQIIMAPLTMVRGSWVDRRHRNSPLSAGPKLGPELARHAHPKQALGFLGVWFFAMLAPTSLIPGNRQTWAEHRMYLSLAPLAILLAHGLFRRHRPWALPAVLTLGVACGIATHERNRAYLSNFTIWSDTVAKLPSNPFAQYNLGVEYLRRSDPTAAAACFRSALALNPAYAEAHNNLGNALLALGQSEPARAEFATAVRLRPDNAEFQNNLGNIALQQHRYAAAETAYHSAIALDPNFDPPRHALVQLYSREGIEFLSAHRYPEAIAAFTQGVQLEPTSAPAHMNCARALSLAGDFPRALPEYQAALRLAPQNASYHYTYGSALVAAHRPAEAKGEYLEALRLDPHFTQAKLRLDLLETP